MHLWFGTKIHSSNYSWEQIITRLVERVPSLLPQRRASRKEFARG